MTKETKLGLLIGGLFILGFAVILSKMDDRESIQQQVAALQQSSSPQHDVATQASNGRMPEELVKSVASNTNIETRSSQPPPALAMGAKSNGIGNLPSNPPSGQSVVAPMEKQVDTTLRQSPLPTDLPPHPMATDANAIRPLASSDERAGRVENKPPTHSSKTTDLLLKQFENYPAPNSIPTASPKAAQQPSASPPALETSREHVVVANDNLTKIAKKYYGKGSHQNVQRIIQANPATLKGEKTVLKVGQKLKIPLEPAKGLSDKTSETLLALADATPNNPPAVISKTKESRPSQAPVSTEADWSWYQVKANDRYTKIAREQLGNEKRWKEIHELNKEKFANPNQIRPGVRIKIPKK